LARHVGLVPVPCPYFLPQAPLQETKWAVPPRAPLGVLHAGECRAGTVPQVADHERCNFGYARGECGKFPSDAAVDAVRFAVDSREPGLVRILYVLEREHAPLEHGRLTFSIADRRLEGAETSPLLEAQARVFVERSGLG